MKSVFIEEFNFLPSTPRDANFRNKTFKAGNLLRKKMIEKDVSRKLEIIVESTPLYLDT